MEGYEHCLVAYNSTYALMAGGHNDYAGSDAFWSYDRNTGTYKGGRIEGLEPNYPNLECGSISTIILC